MGATWLNHHESRVTGHVRACVRAGRELGAHVPPIRHGPVTKAQTPKSGLLFRPFRHASSNSLTVTVHLPDRGPAPSSSTGCTQAGGGTHSTNKPHTPDPCVSSGFSSSSLPHCLAVVAAVTKCL